MYIEYMCAYKCAAQCLNRLRASPSSHNLGCIYICMDTYIYTHNYTYIYTHVMLCVYIYICSLSASKSAWHSVLQSLHVERWGAGVETQKNVRGEIGGWGRVPFNEPYAPSLSTIYDGA